MIALNFSIQSELKNFSKQLDVLQRQALSKAVARALSRVSTSAKSVSTKHIVPQINISQADIKRKIVEDRTYPRKLWASRITAVGSSLKLIEFKAKATAKGVVAKA